jgi:hypothetical protein
LTVGTIQTADCMSVKGEADQKRRLEAIHANGAMLVGPRGRQERIPAVKISGVDSYRWRVMAAWRYRAFQGASLDKRLSQCGHPEWGRGRPTFAAVRLRSGRSNF